jgi:hypothetical protein
VLSLLADIDDLATKGGMQCMFYKSQLVGLARKVNSRGSEFIREGAGAFAAYVLSEILPSRINSVPQVNDKPEIIANLWERGLPAIQAMRSVRKTALSFFIRMRPRPSHAPTDWP